MGVYDVRGTSLGSKKEGDATIWGSILGVPYFRNPPISSARQLYRKIFGEVVGRRASAGRRMSVEPKAGATCPQEKESMRAFWCLKV